MGWDFKGDQVWKLGRFFGHYLLGVLKCEAS